MTRFASWTFATIMLLSISAGASTLAEMPSNDNPLVIRWKNLGIRISVSSSLINPNPNIKTGTDVADVVRRSLAAWQNASGIKFAQSVSDRQSVSPQGIAGDGISLITIAQTPENLSLFQNDPQATSAKSRVFYNRKGEITEADIVLNPFVQFSDDGTFGTFDLQSTLIHELGHLLGLDHSFSLGSVMYENSGRNGLFGLQARGGRTLSPEDLAALQRLYGDQAGDDLCCGVSAGRLAVPIGRRGSTFQIWAEDTENGRIAGSAISQKNGNYRIGGLPVGSYRIYAQDDNKKRAASLSYGTGEVDIEKGKTSSLDLVLLKRSADIDLRFIGLNGQLASAAVPVNPGRTYTLYFGGSNLATANLTVGSNSKFITVNSGTVSNYDFSDTVGSMRAEVTIDAEAPLGDYTLYLQNEAGNRRYIVGGLKVNSFADPWDISAVFTR
ncbi:MAG: matrixin family metalloprotease [Acidobacteriota bacterium]